MRVLALALLTLTTSAIAQHTPPNTQRIRPMSQETPTTAFFYQKPVVLDREQHKGLRLKNTDARFAAKPVAVAADRDRQASAALERERRAEQERAEDVDDPVELLEQHGTEGDEDRAEDERSEDAEEEHAVLQLPRDGEVGEDHGEDEDVVDRERLLDEEAGEVLAGVFGAVTPEDDGGEGQAEADPDH